MKRRVLTKRLRSLGWWLARHGGKHDVWTNGEREIPVPRHNEIHEGLARRIIRYARGR